MGVWAKLLWAALAVLLAVGGVGGVRLWLAAGKVPSGERLARCERSPHWRGGQFVNEHPTPTMTGKGPAWKQMLKFLFRHPPELRPETPLPARPLPAELPDGDCFAWLGHSSCLLSVGGVRFLFDPVLTHDFPFNLMLRPFPRERDYAPGDLPPFDVLVITHDHWDHLDWNTMRALRKRLPGFRVVCPLGVGAHLEAWGYPADAVTELDWGESVAVSESVTLRCLPSRHFSGRLFTKNRSVWASWLVDGPRRVFVSGDGGADDRFGRFGREYPGIDWAILENGQYDPGWRHIHTLPDELPGEILALGARRVLTVHNGKYTIANHPWHEPLERIREAAQGQPWQLFTPVMGEVVDLAEPQPTGAWWRECRTP